MTGLIIAIALALLIGVAIMVTSRLSVGKLAPLATALLLGLAGYAWQGSPGVAGKPVQPGSAQARFDEALAKKRRDIGERVSRATPFMVLSDSFASRGETKEAADAVSLGLRKYPDDPHLWVGLGNALMAHSNGVMSPAANYSFRQALKFQPDGISPNYFFGLALAESGDFERAKDVWIRLAARLPEDVPLREELIRNVVLLNGLIERRANMARGGNQAP